MFSDHDQEARAEASVVPQTGVNRKLVYDVVPSDGNGLQAAGGETGGNETDEEKLKDSAVVISRY